MRYSSAEKTQNRFEFDHCKFYYSTFLSRSNTTFVGTLSLFFKLSSRSLRSSSSDGNVSLAPLCYHNYCLLFCGSCPFLLPICQVRRCLFVSGPSISRPLLSGSPTFELFCHHVLSCRPVLVAASPMSLASPVVTILFFCSCIDLILRMLWSPRCRSDDLDGSHNYGSSGFYGRSDSCISFRIIGRR